MGIFDRAHLRRWDSGHEFQLFRSGLRAKVDEASPGIAGFTELKEACSFHVDLSREDAAQLWFGLRLMNARTPTGGHATEDGAYLVYSLGHGHIFTTLYPAKSDIARTFEQMIHLRRARSGTRTLERVPADLRDLVAYMRVSSIDADTAWGNQLRVWWLRLTCGKTVDGKFVHPMHWRVLSKAPGLAAEATWKKVAGTVGLVVFTALIVYFITLAGCDPSRVQKLLGADEAANASTTD